MKSIKNIFQYLITSILMIAAVYYTNLVTYNAIKSTSRGIIDYSFLTFHKVRNHGAAFNLFSDNPELIIILSFIAIFGIAVFVLFNAKKLNNLTISALSLLTSGIGMNFYERVTFGYITDYIDLKFIPNMPVFNAADILIVVGSITLIVALLKKK